MVLISLAIVALFIVLLVIDFELGKRVYQNNPPPFNFKRTQGEYQLFKTGDELFKVMFDDMKRAKSSIDIMFFIVRNDDISKKMYDILKQKAQTGVKVRLMVDFIGSYSLKRSIIEDLQDHGVQFLRSNRPRFPYFFYHLNRRNHRKVAIIDNRTGYVGGYNLGKEYLGEDPKLGPWRDYHLKLTGDIVLNLIEVFNYDWECAKTGKKVTPANNGENWPAARNGSMELVVTDGGQLEDTFVDWIHDAQSEILIGTPYFIPSKRMFAALVKALERGITVTIMIPKKADHPLVRPAAFPFLKALYQQGASIHLYDLGFYHAKVMIIDQKLCDIGTANFDRRSVFLNKEINPIIVNDDTFIQSVRSAYFDDIEKSDIFTPQWMKDQALHTKISGVIARLFRPLL
ncbi:cardiolipin synthase [Aquibacillus salsiterrae]|uniref:Cardiolipin synthase n=1 Tax=Aquibacillus salsiterrae TaxID=2950439 RepID=A0A9X3WG25_9BACI|nr:cardiolipin synthase [Aquibacillus salsiterrae]MDC3416794.1 cardiolipin synthase [Aquibacillus salsiterrae]